MFTSESSIFSLSVLSQQKQSFRVTGGCWGVDTWHQGLMNTLHFVSFSLHFDGFICCVLPLYITSSVFWTNYVGKTVFIYYVYLSESVCNICWCWAILNSLCWVYNLTTGLHSLSLFLSGRLQTAFHESVCSGCIICGFSFNYAEILMFLCQQFWCSRDLNVFSGPRKE